MIEDNGLFRTLRRAFGWPIEGREEMESDMVTPHGPEQTPSEKAAIATSQMACSADLLREVARKVRHDNDTSQPEEFQLAMGRLLRRF